MTPTTQSQEYDEKGQEDPDSLGQSLVPTCADRENNPRRHAFISCQRWVGSIRLAYLTACYADNQERLEILARQEKAK